MSGCHRLVGVFVLHLISVKLGHILLNGDGTRNIGLHFDHIAHHKLVGVDARVQCNQVFNSRVILLRHAEERFATLDGVENGLHLGLRRGFGRNRGRCNRRHSGLLRYHQHIAFFHAIVGLRIGLNQFVDAHIIIACQAVERFALFHHMGHRFIGNRWSHIMLLALVGKGTDREKQQLFLGNAQLGRGIIGDNLVDSDTQFLGNTLYRLIVAGLVEIERFVTNCLDGQIKLRFGKQWAKNGHQSQNHLKTN